MNKDKYNRHMHSKPFIHLTCGLILASALAVNLHNLHHPVQRGVILSSEVQGLDEYPITCAPDTEIAVGFSPQIVSGVLPSNDYALQSPFITAAALNYTSNDPVYWAGTYYNNPLSHYYNNPNGSMYTNDLVTWWGLQTFSPMTPIMPDFCMIWQCMDVENRALLIMNGDFVWAIGTLQVLNLQGVQNQDQSQNQGQNQSQSQNQRQTMCECTYVNAGNLNWGIGDIMQMTTDDFIQTVSSGNLYLVDSN